MALDVYVMPIWKFKAGDFASPLAALGIEPVVVGLDGVMQRSRAARPNFLARWKAKHATRRLRREIEAEGGRPVRWNDEGDVAYGQQAYYGFEALRAFAKWLDHRELFSTFDRPPEDNYYKHPVMAASPARPLTYPQLVEHSCYSGYYIPAELERVVHVEPYVIWGRFAFKHSVGSTLRLLDELRGLSGVLGIDGAYAWQDGDPLAEVKASFAQLYEVAKISRERNLPIVFYG